MNIRERATEWLVVHANSLDTNYETHKVIRDLLAENEKQVEEIKRIRSDWAESTLDNFKTAMSTCRSMKLIEDENAKLKAENERLESNDRLMYKTNCELSLENEILIKVKEEIFSANKDLNAEVLRLGLENERLEKEVLRQKANATVDADEVQAAIQTSIRQTAENICKFEGNITLETPAGTYTKEELIINSAKSAMDAFKEAIRAKYLK